MGKVLAVFFAHLPGIPPARSPSPGNHPNKDLTYPHSQDALGAAATGAAEPGQASCASRQEGK